MLEGQSSMGVYSENLPHSFANNPDTCGLCKFHILEGKWNIFENGGRPQETKSDLKNILKIFIYITT